MGLLQFRAEDAVDALFNAMKGAIQRGERIELRGFGAFTVRIRKRGNGQPSKRLRFKPGKKLR